MAKFNSLHVENATLVPCKKNARKVANLNTLYYICAQISARNMETAMKVSTSFRLNADLVERMKVAAKASNRSLNNFVESILLNVMYRESAESTTLAAIEEAKAQQQAYREGKTQVEAIDLSSVENMLKSMGI